MRPSMLCLLFILTSGCALMDPFASSKPLFPWLNESHMTDTARSALAEAKTDFECARKAQPPRHARLIHLDPTLGHASYQGRGYKLTIYAGGPRHRVGPRIVVEPEITRGRPYHYDESYVPFD